ncbi:MAG: ankyrin repeat domain-containing protein [Deltaproteobacteria bacterium]|nr:ankyrin repeat domain-containing protein [Deltaproteobacteria bacterium]
MHATADRREVAFLIVTVGSILAGMLYAGWFGGAVDFWICLAIAVASSLASAWLDGRTARARLLSGLGFLAAGIGALFTTAWYVEDRSEIWSLELAIPLALGAGPGLLFTWLAAPAILRAGERARGPARLIEAVQTGDVEALAALLAGGGDPIRADESGKTPLHWAAMLGKTAAARALVDAGCPLDAPDGKNGYPPLVFACIHGHTETISLLVERGARVDAAGPSGKTALHLAAFAGQRQAVEQLLEHGADPGSQDSQGLTPAQMARTAGHPEIASLLEPGAG